MKTKYMLLIAIVLLGLGCSPPAEEPKTETLKLDLEAERNALMATDKRWSESVGDTEEFLSFFTADAYFMPYDAPLVRGEAIRTTWEQLVSTPGFAVEWAATSAYVAESGDLGYTIGAFELTSELDGDTMVTVGKYVTVWSKQADGTWKVQVDSFNTNEPQIAAEEP